MRLSRRERRERREGQSPLLLLVLVAYELDATLAPSDPRATDGAIREQRMGSVTTTSTCRRRTRDRCDSSPRAIVLNNEQEGQSPVLLLVVVAPEIDATL